MVREAELSDYESLHKLFIEENRYIYSIAPDKTALTEHVLDIQELESLIDRENRLIAVAENAESLVGLVNAKHIVEPESRWSPSVSAVYVEVLFVSEYSRSNGIGSELFQFTKECALKRGTTSLELDVWNESKLAINLSRKYGMKSRRRYMTTVLE